MLQRKKSRAEAAQTAWFEATYRSEYSKMLRIARLQILRSGLSDAVAEDRAQDAVQRTFVVAWNLREELMKKPSPVGWLYEALKRKTMAVISAEWKWRNRVEQLELYSRSDSGSAASPDAEERILLGTVATPEELQLLKKLYLVGYTYDTLSKELGISRSALAMKIHRLKKKISEEFQE